MERPVALYQRKTQEECLVNNSATSDFPNVGSYPSEKTPSVEIDMEHIERAWNTESALSHATSMDQNWRNQGPLHAFHMDISVDYMAFHVKYMEGTLSVAHSSSL